MEDREVDRKNLRPPDADDDLLASEPVEGSQWERLTGPPRVVSVSIRLRMAIAKFRGVSAMAGLFGGFCFVGSVVFFSIADPTMPVETAVGWGLLLVGLVSWFVAGSVLYFRVQSTVDLFSRGQLLSGRITHVYDRSGDGYESYESTVEGFRELAGSPYGSGVSGSMMSQQLRDWRVKFLIEDSGDVINARLDLGARLVGQKDDPRAQCLVHSHRGKQRVVMVDQFPWLSVSEDGELEYGVRQDAEEFGFGKSLARAFLVVLLTYALAVLGLSLNAKPLLGLGGEMPAVVGAIVVLLFTLTHGVGPVFFYHLFASVLDAESEDSAQRFNPRVLFARCFFYLHFGVWYGAPIIWLASLTGWLSPAWVILDVLRAGHGRRRWAFLQHGSTSVALVLFLTCFSGEKLFPVGLLVVLLQSLLLTVIEWKGKRLWVKEGDTG